MRIFDRLITLIRKFEMPTTRVRKTAKPAKTAAQTEKKSKQGGKSAVPKSNRNWYFIPLEPGGYQRIFRPRGKTTVPLSVIRKAVRKVIAERLAKEANEANEGQDE